MFDGGLFRAELPHGADRALGAHDRADDAGRADELLDIIGEVVRRSELQDAHVRPIIARGFGGPGIDPRNCPEPTLIVSAYPFPPFLGSDPIKLFTSASCARRRARSART